MNNQSNKLDPFPPALFYWMLRQSKNDPTYKDKAYEIIRQVEDGEREQTTIPCTLQEIRDIVSRREEEEARKPRRRLYMI